MTTINMKKPQKEIYYFLNADWNAIKSWNVIWLKYSIIYYLTWLLLRWFTNTTPHTYETSLVKTLDLILKPTYKWLPPSVKSNLLSFCIYCSLPYPCNHLIWQNAIRSRLSRSWILIKSHVIQNTHSFKKILRNKNSFANLF
jgi:hypothetical protein